MRLHILLLLFSLSAAAQTSLSYVIDSVAGSDPVTEGGLAALALIGDARAIAVDPVGNVYFSDAARHRVFKITPNGRISTVAGNGVAGSTADNVPALSTSLNQPYGLALDSAGNLFIADLGNACVRKVSLDGRIRTVAGGGYRPVNDTSVATEIALKAPRNVAVDSAGVLYISDFLDHRVLRVTPDGRLNVFAGSGTPGAPTGSVPATSGFLSHPAALAVDNTGVYVADSGNNVIRKISLGVMTSLHFENASGLLNLPTGICIDSAGNLYVASSGYSQVVRIDRTGATISLTTAVRDLAIDTAGNLYLAAGPYIRKVAPNGQVITLSGIGSQFIGEGVPALQALFNSPGDVKFDSSGALYVADTRNHCIRKIIADTISTVAGDGKPGFDGDQATGTSARFDSPQGLAFDRAGNLYIADTANNRVRRIAPDGKIATVAGTGRAGFNGDVRMAKEAQLNGPTALAVDALGQLHIADTGNHRVRRLLASGYLVTIAGNGEKGFAGDGTGTQIVQLNSPRGLIFDGAGNLFIADSGNHRIRKIAVNGVASTVAGNGVPSFSGDGGKAAEASLNEPSGLTMDSTGALMVTDAGNHRIRLITPDGNILTIAGDGARGFSGDAGPALRAKLDAPAGVAIDSHGVAYFADRNNHRIRKLVRGAVVPPSPVSRPPEVQVMHAATLQATSLTPGMLISLKGNNIGPVAPSSGQPGPGGALETILSGAEVRFDGRPAPILYAQRNMINTQVPYRLSGQPLVLVEVFRDAEVLGSAVVEVAPHSPGIFTSAGGSGQITAMNDDSTLNTTASPAARGSLLTFYATGEGLTDPGSIEGKLSEAPYPRPQAALEVIIGGHPADIVTMSCGVTSPGVLQLVVRIPGQLEPGTHGVVLKTGGVPSQRNATIAVR